MAQRKGPPGAALLSGGAGGAGSLASVSEAPNAEISVVEMMEMNLPRDPGPGSSSHVGCLACRSLPRSLPPSPNAQRSVQSLCFFCAIPAVAPSSLLPPVQPSFPSRLHKRLVLSILFLSPRILRALASQSRPYLRSPSCLRSFRYDNLLFISTAVFSRHPNPFRYHCSTSSGSRPCQTLRAVTSQPPFLRPTFLCNPQIWSNQTI
ncbi:hypothetical protein CC78DRAFT_576401 [Lojkania enalia]|uniref:Uncharacterized protein n=1 Tax=Lojkania enalia TaxID=147567 RepID=A0A9P4KFX6_9PLEO|nr:hypothetical protein CC78DRAFT_576401 [Didymosphaeria enalia]